MSCRYSSHLFMVLMLVFSVAVVLTFGRACHAKPLVYLMGDSQAFLLQYDLKPLVEADDYEFKAEPVPGSSVIQWADSLAPSWARLRGAKPAIVLVSLGSNDACMGKGVVANEPPFLERFMRRLSHVPGHVIWLGPPAIGSLTRLPLAPAGLEAFAQMIQGNTGLLYLDARTQQVGLWNDQLHCSRPQHPRDKSTGCNTWAQWAWTKVKEAHHAKANEPVHVE